MTEGYRQTCIACGGDGFLYDDRGVPSICWGCGGRGSTPGPVFPNPKRGRTVQTPNPFFVIDEVSPFYSPPPRPEYGPSPSKRGPSPSEPAEADEFPVIVYDTGEKPLCDHPGPRCTDCEATGCPRRCRPYKPCGNKLAAQDAHAIHEKEKK